MICSRTGARRCSSASRSIETAVSSPTCSRHKPTSTQERAAIRLHVRPAREGISSRKSTAKDHDWFTIQVEPRDLEEVQISRFNRRRNIRDVWSSFHSLDDFTPGTLPDPFTAPPPKRDESDAAGHDGRDDAPEPRSSNPAGRARSGTLVGAGPGSHRRRRPGTRRQG